MNSQHIIKSYDEELGQLNGLLGRMGELAEHQLAAAIEAVVKRNSDGAAEVIAGDAEVDQLERDIDALVVRVFALRQPMARDLREVFAALRAASDLERIGDYAANVAKRAIALNQATAVEPVATLPRLAQLANGMIREVRDAWVERDTEKALAVWRRDADLDAMYAGFFRELLTYMMEDPRTIGSCTHLLFMAKNIERIGDHTTNVAENLYYLVEGTPIEAARPKGDNTSIAITLPGRSGGAG